MNLQRDSDLLSPVAEELRLEAWSGLDGLIAQSEAWTELFRSANVDPLCNHFEWALAHAESFARGQELFGWTVYASGGEPVALLPLRMEPKRSLLALPRVFLAQDGTFDSEYLDLLIRPGYERAALELLLDTLTKHRGADCVLLSGIPDDSSSLVVLRSLLEERGLPSRERPLPSCAAELPESFDDYLAGLKSRMRSKVRSSMRKVEAAGAHLVWCNGEEQLEQDLESLFELHQKRWALAGMPGSFQGRERRNFYRALAPVFLERDQLAFAKLELDGRTIACQFGALAGSAYYQIQEGYDPDFAELRVGVALRGMVVEQLIKRGLKTYDFMAGIAQHKTDWGAVSRPCTTLAFALPRLRARLAYGLRAYWDRRRG